MTVAAITPQVEYMENGISLNFPAPFRYDDLADLEVARIIAGVVTILPQDVAWSATIGSTDDGGTVTLVSSVSGALLRIRRTTARNQSTNYQNGDRFPAESHEDALDRQMRIAQEQDVTIEDTRARGALAPEGDVGFTLPASADRASRLPAYDLEGGLGLMNGSNVVVVLDALQRPAGVPVFDVLSSIGTTILDDGTWGGSFNGDDGAWG